VRTYSPIDDSQVSLVRKGFDKRDFMFDHCLNMDSDQETAYRQLAQPVVNDVLSGFNGVIMAYGQTGSGKTHTIFGSKPSGELNYQSGIVPRIVHQIFDYVKRENPNKAQFRVTISFLEIYMEQITDLLSNANGASGTNLNQNSSHSQRTVSHSPIRPASAVHQISTSSLAGAQA
jgi:kinesin family protein 15